MLKSIRYEAFAQSQGNGNKKRGEKAEDRGKNRDRHLPKIQGGVPGGRFFLTSMFCFIKAAN